MWVKVNGKRFPVLSLEVIQNCDGDFDISVTIDGCGDTFVPVVKGVIPPSGDLLDVSTWLVWRGYSQPLRG